MRAGRAVGDILAGLPAHHGAGMDAELAGQRGMRGAALLDIGAGPRGGGGIGMQPELHQRVLPCFGLRRNRLTKTLAPVGPQGPPARRAAGLVAVATRARAPVDYRDELRRCSHEPLPQPSDSLPQPRTVAPFFRD